MFAAVVKGLMQMQILEMPSFTLKQGVSEQKMLQAHAKFNIEFMKKQEGYVSHKLVKQGDVYFDIAVWSSEKTKNKAFKDIYNSSATIEYVDLIDSVADDEIPLFSVLKDYDC